ncbi:hypothetical protein L6452_28859 [Arctium lappa]|uniref:Uncharacterized protein n=1 Tax=Arctium lappa TaxID=4217 RepID=A0ACB9A0F7_ARCLA|nr:hypothetical protein L6452_28859 [Arctium lappa]
MLSFISSPNPIWGTIAEGESARYGCSLVKEQNSEVVDLNHDIFRCLDVVHHKIDGLRAPISAALESVLKDVVKLNDQNSSLTLSVAALKAASDARDQDLISLRQQASTHESINSAILSALQSLNQRLDSITVEVAQYCAHSLDIDITESAFTPDDRTVLERIDRRVGRVSARAGVSSPAQVSAAEPITAAEPSTTEEKGTEHPLVVEESEGKKLPKKDKGKTIMSPDEVAAEEKRCKDALIKKAADSAGLHLPPPKTTSPDLGLSEEEFKAAKLAQIARDKDTELTLKLAEEEAAKSPADAIKAQLNALEDSTKKNEEIKSLCIDWYRKALTKRRSSAKITDVKIIKPSSTCKVIRLRIIRDDASSSMDRLDSLVRFRVSEWMEIGICLNNSRNALKPEVDKFLADLQTKFRTYRKTYNIVHTPAEEKVIESLRSDLPPPKSKPRSKKEYVFVQWLEKERFRKLQI